MFGHTEVCDWLLYFLIWGTIQYNPGDRGLSSLLSCLLFLQLQMHSSLSQLRSKMLHFQGRHLTIKRLKKICLSLLMYEINIGYAKLAVLCPVNSLLVIQSMVSMANQ